MRKILTALPLLAITAVTALAGCTTSADPYAADAPTPPPSPTVVTAQFGQPTPIDSEYTITFTPLKDGSKVYTQPDGQTVLITTVTIVAGAAPVDPMRLNCTIVDANAGTVNTSGFGENSIPAGQTHVEKNVALFVDEAQAQGSITITIGNADGSKAYTWTRA